MKAPTIGWPRLSRPWIAVLVVYALWLAWSYVVLLRSSPVYVWHFALYAFVAVLHFRPQWIRPRRGKPKRIHFGLVTVLWISLVARPLASLGRGDLHPDLVVNAALWLGGSIALAAAWLWLIVCWRWKPLPLFFIAGMLAFAEPGFVVLRAVQAGAWTGLFVLLPVLHATHACLVAPVANAYRDALGTEASPLNRAGIAAAIALPIVAYLAGSVLWFEVARFALKTAVS